jgi:uncharacterized UPF0160 family protein
MATAILKEIFEIELTRTRDENILNTLDIVYDVGGGEFDHHDMEKRYREDGIPYAACGLIWERFGKEVVKFRDQDLSEEDIESIYVYVDRVLVKGIDALDNGVNLDEGNVSVMSISSILSGFNPPWYSEKDEDEAFSEAVIFASNILNNTINNKYSAVKSREKVIEAYSNRPMPEIIVMDVYCPWGESIRNIDEKEDVKFVIYPSKENYAMQTIRGRDREDRKKLPKAWAGKRDGALAAITGVEDSVFCHTGRFIATAKSFEGIMELAKLALKEPDESKERSKGLFDYIRKLFFNE